MNQQEKKDREAIEALHQTDRDASKRCDFKTLRTLIDDKGVVLPPGGKILRGQEQLDGMFETFQKQCEGLEILEYVQEFEEVVVLGDYAFEWGIMWGSSRNRESGEIERGRQYLMRILKKQPDGIWKVYRTIWNDAASEGQAQGPA